MRELKIKMIQEKLGYIPCELGEAVLLKLESGVVTSGVGFLTGFSVTVCLLTSSGLDTVTLSGGRTEASPGCGVGETCNGGSEESTYSSKTL